MELKTLFKRKSAAGLVLIESKNLIILFPELINGASSVPRGDSNLAGQAIIPTESVGLKLALCGFKKNSRPPPPPPLLPTLEMYLFVFLVYLIF